jgi:ribonuclease BN (tRNA processing enzyme)
MGFPMFTPVFESVNTLRIRGPVSYEDESLESIINAQLSYRYWPVRASELSAHLEYEVLKETALDLGGGLRVTTKYLNHSILCLGYRFEYNGKSIVTAFDHEPFRNLFPTSPADPGYNEEAAREGELAAAEENEKVIRFFQGADIFIRDAQYTESEYDQHMGWGHSSYGQAVGDAVKAGVKKMVFFHHDPNRTDVQLEQLEKEYRTKAPMETMMAREGMRVEA